MQSTIFFDQFDNAADACALARAIVDTVREPILVLDGDLRVIAASRSFYDKFKVRPEQTQGRRLYTLGDGQWDIPGLRLLLDDIVPQKGIMRDYEVEHDFPDLGHRWMRLNARQIYCEGGAGTTILLGIEDVTERHVAEMEMQALLRHKEILLEETEHRVANSLQIIASIILMKARSVDNEETRHHLQDAHKRVVSVAAVQRQLHPATESGRVDMASYLAHLCETLANSMIVDGESVSLVASDIAGTATPQQAESVGLIVTELVMNALKHAFPSDRKGGRITVSHEVNGKNWKLTVVDNGIGRDSRTFAQPKTGLGTGIVTALAQQLGAAVETVADRGGTRTTVTHAEYPSKFDSVDHATRTVPPKPLAARELWHLTELPNH